MIFKEYKKLNLSKISDEILLYWKNQDIFKKSVEQSKDKNPFIFFEGPPSANGLPGIHHVLARSIKDIFLRYKTMKGYHVKRKAGWDTHGLPIELKVSKNAQTRAYYPAWMSQPPPANPIIPRSIQWNTVHEITTAGATIAQELGAQRYDAYPAPQKGS